MTDSLIYRLFDPVIWDAFGQEGVFRGTNVDLKDGFIHFSARDQVITTADKHYRDYDALILAAISINQQSADLKWEVSRGGAKFLHLYRDLKLSEVKAYWELPSDGLGGYIWPEGFSR